MFGNFIYFIVVLLIFATYQPAKATNFTGADSACLFVSFILFYAGFAWIFFRRLEDRIGRVPAALLDRRFTAIQLRLSIAAIALFVVDIYGLNLTDFLSRIHLFDLIPTLQALICVAVFTGYLALMWGISYSVHRRLYPSPVSRSSYVLSNISFAVPVLMPWLVLSGMVDIIYALPFAPLKQFLSSMVGEVSCFLTFLAAIAILGPAMIQKLWRCRSLPPGTERRQIEDTCRRAKVSYRDIVQWPLFGGHMITAAVLGLVRRFRYILVTRALLQHLTQEELDAVIAHEIGHVKKHHLLFYLFFLTGYILIAYASFDLIVMLVYYIKPAYLLAPKSAGDPTGLTSVLFGVAMVVSFLIYFRYVFGYFMRNFERQADAYAFSMFHTAVPLVSTFQKIAYMSGQPADKPNWHHFSIRQRIDFLERCEADRSLVGRHNRKMRRGIAGFLLALLIFGFVGYQLNFGQTGAAIDTHLLTMIFQREIKKHPGDAGLLANLGDLYYQMDAYAKTIDAYERALAVDPNLSEVANNLAWLYATCKDPRYRNPRRALVLARQAAAETHSPEVLDTLAESLYVNGRIDDAIAVERRALSMAGGDRNIYQARLNKFMAAENGL